MNRYKSFLLFLLFILVSQSMHGQQKYEALSTFEDGESGITVMTRDPSFRYLIAGDLKGNLYFRDLVTGELKKKINAHGAAVKQLQFNSNGKLLISATADGEIKIFDFNKDKIVQSIYSPGYSGINFVLFSIADGFIYFNGHRTLYKTRSDLTQPVYPLITENDTIYDAVITSDRNSLIYATGPLLKVMNTRTDGVTQEYRSGNSPIKRISLVRDTQLVTWSEDGTMNFWRYRLGQIEPNPVFFLKAGAPSTMNFSDNGNLLCTGGIGNWARLWKPRDRTIAQELFTHSSTITSSVFGLSENVLYTGSLDKSIVQWRFGAQKPVVPPPTVAAKLPDTIKKEVIPPPPPPPAKNKNVVMNAQNVPEYISGRKVLSTQKIEVTQPNINIYVYDNSFVDGDTMSLFFNGVWILDHFGVTKKKQLVELKFTPNTNNYLVLFANNLGKSPPNTAAIEFDDGKSMRFFKLSSDLKSCSAINFYYKQ